MTTIKDAFDSITKKMEANPIPCPPCKPPKAPNPSKPQTSFPLGISNGCGDGFSASPAEQAEPQSVQYPSRESQAHRGEPLKPQQPDALARLEAWLAEHVGLRRVDIEQNGFYGWRVCLRNISKSRIAIAKEPGLGPTIHAAIDKAEKVKL